MTGPSPYWDGRWTLARGKEQKMAGQPQNNQPDGGQQRQPRFQPPGAFNPNGFPNTAARDAYVLDWVRNAAGTDPNFPNIQNDGRPVREYINNRPDTARGAYSIRNNMLPEIRAAINERNGMAPAAAEREARRNPVAYELVRATGEGRIQFRTAEQAPQPNTYRLTDDGLNEAYGALTNTDRRVRIGNDTRDAVLDAVRNRARQEAISNGAPIQQPARPLDTYQVMRGVEDNPTSAYNQRLRDYEVHLAINGYDRSNNFQRVPGTNRVQHENGRNDFENLFQRQQQERNRQAAAAANVQPPAGLQPPGNNNQAQGRGDDDNNDDGQGPGRGGGGGRVAVGGKRLAAAGQAPLSPDGTTQEPNAKRPGNNGIAANESQSSAQQVLAALNDSQSQNFSINTQPATASQSAATATGTQTQNQTDRLGQPTPGVAPAAAAPAQNTGAAATDPASAALIQRLVTQDQRPTTQRQDQTVADDQKTAARPTETQTNTTAPTSDYQQNLNRAAMSLQEEKDDASVERLALQIGLDPNEPALGSQQPSNQVTNEVSDGAAALRELRAGGAAAQIQNINVDRDLDPHQDLNAPVIHAGDRADIANTDFYPDKIFDPQTVVRSEFIRSSPTQTDAAGVAINVQPSASNNSASAPTTEATTTEPRTPEASAAANNQNEKQSNVQRGDPSPSNIAVQNRDPDDDGDGLAGAGNPAAVRDGSSTAHLGNESTSGQDSSSTTTQAASATASSQNRQQSVTEENRDADRASANVTAPTTDTQNDARAATPSTAREDNTDAVMNDEGPRSGERNGQALEGQPPAKKQRLTVETETPVATDQISGTEAADIAQVPETPVASTRAPTTDTGKYKQIIREAEANPDAPRQTRSDRQQTEQELAAIDSSPSVAAFPTPETPAASIAQPTTLTEEIRKTVAEAEANPDAPRQTRSGQQQPEKETTAPPNSPADISTQAPETPAEPIAQPTTLTGEIRKTVAEAEANPDAPRQLRSNRQGEATVNHAEPTPSAQAVQTTVEIEDSASVNSTVETPARQPETPMAEGQSQSSQAVSTQQQATEQPAVATAIADQETVSTTQSVGAVASSQEMIERLADDIERETREQYRRDYGQEALDREDREQAELKAKYEAENEGEDNRKPPAREEDPEPSNIKPQSRDNDDDDQAPGTSIASSANRDAVVSEAERILMQANEVSQQREPQTPPAHTEERAEPPSREASVRAAQLAIDKFNASYGVSERTNSVEEPGNVSERTGISQDIANMQISGERSFEQSRPASPNRLTYLGNRGPGSRANQESNAAISEAMEDEPIQSLDERRRELAESITSLEADDPRNPNDGAETARRREVVGALREELDDADIGLPRTRNPALIQIEQAAKTSPETSFEARVSGLRKHIAAYSDQRYSELMSIAPDDATPEAANRLSSDTREQAAAGHTRTSDVDSSYAASRDDGTRSASTGSPGGVTYLGARGPNPNRAVPEPSYSDTANLNGTRAALSEPHESIQLANKRARTEHYDPSLGGDRQDGRTI